jgi:maltose O-acetyltransferase
MPLAIIKEILKRFWWDITNPNQRIYFTYWLLSGIPGLTGDLIRGRYLSRQFKYAGKNLRVSAGARFRCMENLIVGDNVEIGYDNFIQALGGVTIGNNVILGPGVKIWSVNHQYQRADEVIRKQGYAMAPVTIGNDVWIASNAFIAPGVDLPDGVVVSAGAVVHMKLYKDYSIVAGHPARIIGFRGEREDARQN